MHEKKLLIATDVNFVLTFLLSFSSCPPCFHMGEYQVFSIPLTLCAPPAWHLTRPGWVLSSDNKVALPTGFLVGCARIWG